MKKCPICGRKIKDDAIKCKKCQKFEDFVLKKDEIFTDVNAIKICPKCKVVYDLTWEICLKCNTPLEKQETKEPVKIKRQRYSAWDDIMLFIRMRLFMLIIIILMFLVMFLPVLFRSFKR